MNRKLRIPALILLLALLFTGCGQNAVSDPEPESQKLLSFGDTSAVAAAAVSEEASEIPDEAAEPAASNVQESDTGAAELQEYDSDGTDGAGIYSYVQTVTAYEDGVDWTGEWCYIQEDGSSKKFANFGCGICCLANICCTLTDTICTPGEMYYWAKENTSYAGDGAISWDQLSDVVSAMGLQEELGTVSDDYSAFQQLMASSTTMLVLVSSYYDDVLWQNLPGHYVTLWQYDSATDTVFLTDSSRIKNNRQRVALRDVYNALDLSDVYQYLRIPR